MSVASSSSGIGLQSSLSEGGQEEGATVGQTVELFNALFLKLSTKLDLILLEVRELKEKVDSVAVNTFPILTFAAKTANAADVLVLCKGFLLRLIFFPTDQQFCDAGQNLWREMLVRQENRANLSSYGRKKMSNFRNELKVIILKHPMATDEEMKSKWEAHLKGDIICTNQFHKGLCNLRVHVALGSLGDLASKKEDGWENYSVSFTQGLNFNDVEYQQCTQLRIELG